MSTYVKKILLIIPVVLVLGLAQASGGTLSKKTYNFDSVEELEKFLEVKSYTLADVKNGKYLEVTGFPEDFASIRSVRKKKKLFGLVLLPLVLAENERLEKNRKWLKRIESRLNSGDTSLAPVQETFARRMLVRYNIYETSKDLPKNIKAEDIAKLLDRVNVVPPSLVMAQAANESAWGGSRFCLEANNIFGEWIYNRDKGLKPSGIPDTAPHRIRIFETLMDSVRGYMHNLNTNNAYAKFREIRSNQSESKNSLELVNGLHSYSERGSAYVEDIASLIKYNDYKKFDSYL